MSDQLKVYCINLKEYVDFKGGETLLELSRRLPLGFKPICARVNNKTENLSFPLFSPKQVEFLTKEHPSGQRTYVRTLCMILYRAVDRLFPGARLRIAHSISRGYYCTLSRPGLTLDAESVGQIESEMCSIIKADMPIRFKERLTSDAIEIFRRQGLDSKVRLLETTNRLYTVYYKLDDLCDSYNGTLAPSTGFADVFSLMPYKDGFLLHAFDPADPSRPAGFVPQEKMFKAFTDYNSFNTVLGMRNVGDLNTQVLAGRSETLINVAEALHDKYIARISDEITRRYDNGGARIVLIAGPSSSGKTTTAKRLGIQLMTNLLKPQVISLDDYFVDRHRTPRDADGDYDYENIHALDLELFNNDLNAILRGENVELPTYNFATGTREYRGNKIKLDDRSVLLIEGIHGLNPELTSRVPEQMKFRVYVSALTTLAIDDHNWIPTTDTRLLRRIIRDAKYRGASALDTLRRWGSVRRGEEKWIFPYQENADATFNSSLLFEISVIKNFAQEVLEKVPHNVPEYGEAYRLLKFLSYFVPIRSENIPSTSLLREFVGGSTFRY